MTEGPNKLAERFEENRKRLGKLAHRMLGSESEAEDAVQEAWVRLSRSDTQAIDNLSGWLTTVVARICLDMLRSRARRREGLAGIDDLARISDTGTLDPEQEVILSDSIGPALQVVLDRLSPAERASFVLHDLFDVPFQQIADIIGRTEAASRQLASRARHRVRVMDADANLQARPDRQIVDAFLRAAREGDLHALLSLLHPECELSPDEFAQLTGRARPMRGASNIADFLNGAAFGIRRATIDGVVGAVFAPRGAVRAALRFTVRGKRIGRIEVIADRMSLTALKIALLDDASPQD